MATTSVRAYMEDLRSSEQSRQNRAFQALLKATDNPVPWVYDVWDDLSPGEPSTGATEVLVPERSSSMRRSRASFRAMREADRRSALGDFYRNSYRDLDATRQADIQRAVQAVQTVYRQNVFPEMKVTFGTYANNIGHIESLRLLPLSRRREGDEGRPENRPGLRAVPFNRISRAGLAGARVQSPIDRNDVFGSPCKGAPREARRRSA